MRQSHGWMYRTTGTPRYIVVQLKIPNQVEQPKETFADDQQGAREAAQFVTDRLGRDDWKLESMEFLGYQIVTGTAE